MNPDEIKAKVNATKINNLLKPGKYFQVEEIPKLGSGKTDFSAAKKLTIELLKGQ